jgi:hypothetical protein
MTLSGISLLLAASQPLWHDCPVLRDPPVQPTALLCAGWGFSHEFRPDAPRGIAMLKVPLGLPRKQPVRDHPLTLARLRSCGAHTESDAAVVALAGALTTGAGGVMMPE